MRKEEENMDYAHFNDLLVDNTWLNLQMKINLDDCLCRKVLFEKYNTQSSKQIEMTNFLMSKMNGCELFVNKNHPGCIFYGKCIEKSQQIEILMEQNIKNKAFYLKYSGLWQVFENEYGMFFREISAFIQKAIHCLLKLDNYRILQHPVVFDKIIDKSVKIKNCSASWKEFGYLKC